MPKKRIFLIFLLLLLSADIFAAPICPNAPIEDTFTKTVDLTSELPPIRDQGSVGWCYAFTAADLLTHYLYRTKGKALLPKTNNGDFLTKKKTVSAMGFASVYNSIFRKDYGKSLKEKSSAELTREGKSVVAVGGFMQEALTRGLQRGFCFEEEASSADFSYIQDYRCLSKDQCKINEILNIIYDSPRQTLGCNDLKTIQYVFPTLPVSKIANVLSASAKADALENLVNVACQNKLDAKVQPKFDTKIIQIGNSSKPLIDTIESNLDQGIPVGVNYYADFLFGGKARHVPHSSSIVGKKFNIKTCEVEYILRNSWGSDCNLYKKENPLYTVCYNTLAKIDNAKDYFNGLINCRKKNPLLDYNPRVRCDEATGYLYVRKSDFEKQVYVTTTIK